MQMFLLRRMVTLVPLLIGVTFISFLIMNLSPGDPTAIYIDPSMGEHTQEMREAVQRSLGLDRPLPVRYALWLGRLVVGDLGYSFVSRRPVTREISSRIMNTVLLASASLGVALLLGVIIGVYSALNQYKVSDYVVTVLAFIGLSMPNFWFAMVMILVFTGRLGWLPSVGMMDVHVGPTILERTFSVLRHLIMPTLVLSLAHMATWTRYQRSSMLEVIRQDYIRTARAKGLSERVVIYRHALRNAAIPVITLLGMSMPALISGSFIVETVFAWPGMGRLGVGAVFSRDYPVVMGVTLFSSVMVMGGNLLADVMYAVVDPRIRYK